MEFEYDPQKSARNLAKHGIGFGEAQRLWDGPHLRASAKKRGEHRYAVVGMARGICWTAIATDRGDRVRIISVRRATEKERSYYVQHQDNAREP